MQRFYHVFLGVSLFLAASAVPVFAAPPQAALQSLPPQVEATNLLVRGQHYERAAALWRAAITEKPDDYANYLGLGCAYADRAASLAYAAGFNKMLQAERQSYPARLKKWETAYKDTKDAPPRPKMPPAQVLPTLDDNVPYQLTEGQRAAQWDDLSAKAQAAWDKAAVLAKTEKEKAQVEYVRGWGLRLLLLYGDDADTANAAPDPSANDREAGAASPAPPPALKNLPPKKAVLAALTKATLLAPDNAVYWQALGDAEPGDEGVRAYEKSLALQPRNAALWAELYRRTLKETYGRGPDFLLKPGEKLADSEKGVGYLARAAKYDPTNAWYAYEQAALCFHREMFSIYLITRRGTGGSSVSPPDAQKAIQSRASQKAGRAATAFIEAGNRRAEYRPPPYTPAVPRLLAVAWNYTDFFTMSSFGDTARLREMVRAASGYALAAALENKDTAEGLRVSQVIIEMGAKLAANVPVRDKKGESRIVQASLGMSLAAMGWSNVQKICEATGDTEGATRAKTEMETFQARATAFLQAALADDTGVWELYFP